MLKADFAHIGLCCKDPDTTERFYSAHFGFHRSRVLGTGKDQVVFLKSPSGDLTFELFFATEERKGDAPRGVGPNEPCYRHLAFLVDNVDEALKELEAECPVTAGPMSFDQFIPGWRTAWISDPDGRIIEITQGYTDADKV